MKTPPFPTLCALAFALALAASGCATLRQPLEVKAETVRYAAATQTAPAQAPRRSITGFSSALRCMDDLLADYGVRDVSLLVEEIADRTTKVNAGTRDMLITAVSDMTRRSRALRLVAYGRDVTNAISFLQSAQRANPYQVVPPYDIKGSVSQLDENVIRNTKDLGAGVLPFFNLGISRDAAASVLGLDLSVLTTDDMAVLAGVTSRNSVVILRTGKGLDGDAAYHKFGVSYSMSLSKSEGQTQALRGLVELAVIELAGKLTKVPYWSCLGGDPGTNAEVRKEIDDWYYAMALSRTELIGWFQNQLRQRGFYQGPIDGRFNAATDTAIGNYRAALGLSNEAVLDENFFRLFLAADHSKVTAPEKPAQYTPPATGANAPPAPGATAATAISSAADSAAPLPHPAPQALLPLAMPYPSSSESERFEITIATEPHRARYAPGEAIRLRVQANRDAYIYCYMQDETRRITRFYPNRFDRDALLARGRVLELPGRMRFRIEANPFSRKETIRCFAAGRDVLGQLPRTVVGTDFEPLTLDSMQPIHDAIARASGGAFGAATVQYDAR